MKVHNPIECAADVRGGAAARLAIRRPILLGSVSNGSAACSAATWLGPALRRSRSGHGSVDPPDFFPFPRIGQARLRRARRSGFCWLSCGAQPDSQMTSKVARIRPSGSAKRSHRSRAIRIRSPR